MGRHLNTYDIVADTPHVQKTSTGTADTQTATAPAFAVGCLLTVETTAARVTFDGSTPTSTNGLVIPAGTTPIFIPLGRTIKIRSTAAANSVVNVLWLA